MKLILKKICHVHADVHADLMTLFSEFAPQNFDSIRYITAQQAHHWLAMTDYPTFTLLLLLAVHCTYPGVTYFGLYTVGQSVSITCTGQNPEWLDSSGTTLATGTSTSATLIISVLSDAYHGEVYTCRFSASDSTTLEQREHTIIVTSKYNYSAARMWKHKHKLHICKINYNFSLLFNYLYMFTKSFNVQCFTKCLLLFANANNR